MDLRSSCMQRYFRFIVMTPTGGEEAEGYTSLRDEIAMATRIVSLLVISSLLAVPSLGTQTAESPPGDLEIPRWQPHDFVFRGDVKVDNPFREAFFADVQGPRGVTLALPGFYDGEGTWKIRVRPPPKADGPCARAPRWRPLTVSGRPLCCVANNPPNHTVDCG